MFKKILVAVDGSADSKRAVAAAIDLVACCGAAVTLVHVIRDLALPKELLEMMARGEITESRRELLQDSADIFLQNASSQFQAADIEAQIEKVTLDGDPAWQITNYAKEHEIDLILVGFRGLDTRANMLGSMARKLINVSEVSCLVVK